MPQITAGTLIAPFTGKPLTGAIIIASDRPDNCGKSCNCLVVTFVNGIQQKALNYNAYGTSAVDLPVSVPADSYYGVVSGDPAIVVCDPSKACSSMPFYRSSLSGSTVWEYFATYQPAPIVPQNQSTATDKARLKELESEVLILKARIAAMTARVTEQTKAEAVEELIRSLNLGSNCEPEPEKKLSRNPCCNPVPKEDLDTVSSLMQSIGYHGEETPTETNNADWNLCNPVQAC